MKNKTDFCIRLLLISALCLGVGGEAWAQRRGNQGSTLCGINHPGHRHTGQCQTLPPNYRQQAPFRPAYNAQNVPIRWVGVPYNNPYSAYPGYGYDTAPYGQYSGWPVIQGNPNQTYSQPVQRNHRCNNYCRH